MATVYAIEGGGGDYTSVEAALAAAETDIEVQGPWTSAETANFTVSTGPVTITATGDAKHPGYVGGSPTHWRHRPTSGHAFVTTVDLTIDGLDIGNQSTGTSDEIIRLDAANVDLVIKNSLTWFNSRNSQQDLVYNNARAGCTVLLENCIGWNVNRAIVDTYNADITADINSCHFYDCCDTQAGQVRCGVVSGNGKDLTVNMFNSLFHFNAAFVDAPINGGSIADCTGTQNVDRCIKNTSGTAGTDWSDTTETINLSDSLSSRTWEDADQGAGDYIIVEDLTAGSEDFRLQDLGNSKNNAQDAHADGTGAGLTMPSTDLIGTSRPQNTNYDIGAFEISASSGPNTQTTSIDSLIQKTGIAQTLSIDAFVQSAKSTACELNALIALVQSDQLSIDALLQFTFGSAVSVDALVQATKSGAVSIDAFLKTVFSSSSLLDAILMTPAQRTAEIDALLQKAGLTAGFDMDALIQAAIENTLSLDAILVTAGETSVFLNLDALIQSIRSGSASIDALIEKAYVQQTSLDAIVFALNVETVGLDSLIYRVRTGDLSLDALIQMSAGVSVSIDALLYSVQSGIISMDAVLILLGSSITGLDAMVYLAQSAGVGLDAILGALEIMAHSVITPPDRDRSIIATRRIRTISSPARIKNIKPN